MPGLPIKNGWFIGSSELSLNVISVERKLLFFAICKQGIFWEMPWNSKINVHYRSAHQKWNTGLCWPVLPHVIDTCWGCFKYNVLFDKPFVSLRIFCFYQAKYPTKILKYIHFSCKYEFINSSFYILVTCADILGWQSQYYNPIVNTNFYSRVNTKINLFWRLVVVFFF